MDSWPDFRRYFTYGAPPVLAVSAARSDLIRHLKGPPSRAHVGGRSHSLLYFSRMRHPRLSWQNGHRSDSAALWSNTADSRMYRRDDEHKLGKIKNGAHGNICKVHGYDGIRASGARAAAQMPLSDDLKLVESGLDSLSFAIIVAKLEDEVGFDPFNAEAVEFPITFGDFVHLYEPRPRLRRRWTGKQCHLKRPPEFFAWCRGPLHVPVRTRVAG